MTSLRKLNPINVKDPEVRNNLELITTNLTLLLSAINAVSSIVVINGNYAAKSTDRIIFASAALGAIKLVLFGPSTPSSVQVVKTDASANVVTVVYGVYSEALNAQGDSVQSVTDGSGWLTVN